MKMQKKSLTLLVAGSLLLGSAATFAFGDGYSHDRGGCHHDSPAKMLRHLDGVTDEQREQLRTLFESHRDTKRQHREAMREGRKVIHEAIRNGAGNDEVRKLADKQGERLADMIMVHATMQSKMAEILNEAQMEQLQEYRQERMERHERW